MDHTEYFTLLPSEICRLVLGYLRSHDCMEAATTLFTHCHHLTELRSQYDSVSNLPLNVTQLNLSDIIQDYLKVSNLISNHAAKNGVTCRLGAIADTLSDVLRNNSNVHHVIRARPSWMPVGKSTLPPRIVSADSMIQGFRPPLLAVRPNAFCSYSVSDATSQSVTGLQSTTSLSVRLASSPLSRPVFRVYRHSLQQIGVSTSANSQPATPTVAQLPMSVESKEDPVLTPPSESGAMTDILSDSVVGPSQDLEEVPSSPQILPTDVSSTELISTAQTDSPDEQTIAEPTVETPAPFHVLQYLPPPSEAQMNAQESFKNESLSKSGKSSRSKKRRGSLPRHLPAKREKSESGDTTSKEQEDVDLQRFLCTLFSNPEQVASQINAKICHRSKAAQPQLCLDPNTTMCPSTIVEPTKSGNPPVTSMSSTLTQSDSLQDAVEPITGWLESGEFTTCIDDLLLHLDNIETQGAQPPAQSSPPIQTPGLSAPPTVSTSPITPVTPVPTITSPSKNSSLSDQSLNRPVFSPLCLSQLAKPSLTPVKVPNNKGKRRRSERQPRQKSIKTTSKLAVLHTPDTKAFSQINSPNSDAFAKNLFATDQRMQLYEEYVSCSDTQPISSATPNPIAHSEIYHIRSTLEEAISISTSESSSSFLSPIAETHVNNPTHRRTKSKAASSKASGGFSLINSTQSVHSSQLVRPHSAIQFPSNYLQTIPLTSTQNTVTSTGSVHPTIILYPTADNNSMGKENCSPVAVSTSLSNLQTFTQPIIVRLPPSSGIVTTANRGGIHTVQLQSSDTNSWTVPTTTYMLPVNVDLDSPNPYRMPSNLGRDSWSTTETSSLIIQDASTRQKMLNLGSINVDQILSKSR